MSFLEAGLGAAFPSQCSMAQEPNPDICTDCAVTDAARNLTCPIPEKARIPPGWCGYSHTHLCPMPGFAKIPAKKQMERQNPALTLQTSTRIYT